MCSHTGRLRDTEAVLSLTFLGHGVQTPSGISNEAYVLENGEGYHRCYHVIKVQNIRYSFKKKVTAKPRGRSCSSGRCPTFGVCSEGRRLHIFLSCCWQILQYFSGPHGSRPHVKAKDETTVWGPLSPKHMKGVVLFMPLGLSSAFCLGSLILSPLMPPPRGKQVGRGPALMKPHTSNQQRNLSVMATCGWPPRLCDCYRGGDFLFVAHASSPLQFFLTQLPSPSISIPPSGAMSPECTKLKVFIVDFCKGMVFQARN